jgi:hypothetical protein
VGDLLRWTSPRKDASHRALGYGAVQSIGTQQQAVARPDGLLHHLGLRTEVSQVPPQHVPAELAHQADGEQRGTDGGVRARIPRAMPSTHDGSRFMCGLSDHTQQLHGRRNVGGDDMALSERLSFRDDAGCMHSQ